MKHKYVPFGGGETYLERLASACIARGHEVHLVTTTWPGHRTRNVEIHEVPFCRICAAPRLKVFSSRVADLVARESFDVTFSLDRTERQDIWRAGEGVHPVWLARRRAFEPGLKTWLSEKTWRQRALVQLETIAALNTPHIIANSRMVRDDLLRTYDLDAERVHLIPNGIDLERFSTADRAAKRASQRGHLGVDDDTRIMLFVGSGFRRKGLLETMKVLQRLPNTLLLVLGRDRTGPWEQIARDLRVDDRVWFLGARPALPEMFHAADVTVFPTWFDSFGFVGLESLACGTPLVTTRYAGVAEAVFSGHSGAVIDDPADLDALEHAITAQLQRDISMSDAEEISRSVQGYSLQANTDASLKLIESVCDGKE